MHVQEPLLLPLLLLLLLLLLPAAVVVAAAAVVAVAVNLAASVESRGADVNARSLLHNKTYFDLYFYLY